MSALCLGDLLDELRHNMLHDRSDLIPGGTSDYLWSDDTLVRYINQAHRRFARLSWCIRDNTTPDVTQFTTVANQSSYQLHWSILAVLSVRMAGDKQDLPRANHDALNNYHTPDPLFFDANQLEQLPPGKALTWTTDESILMTPDGTFSAINLMLYPVISSTYAGIVGQLRVIREPLYDFSVAEPDAYPEIPSAHHLDMLDWAAYLALRSVDTDVAGANANARAQEFKLSFEAICEEGRKDVMRKIFAPLEFGFGHNGWSWEGSNF